MFTVAVSRRKWHPADGGKPEPPRREDSEHVAVREQRDMSVHADRTRRDHAVDSRRRPVRGSPRPGSRRVNSIQPGARASISRRQPLVVAVVPLHQVAIDLAPARRGRPARTSHGRAAAGSSAPARTFALRGERRQSAWPARPARSAGCPSRPYAGRSAPRRLAVPDENRPAAAAPALSSALAPTMQRACLGRLRVCGVSDVIARLLPTPRRRWPAPRPECAAGDRRRESSRRTACRRLRCRTDAPRTTRAPVTTFRPPIGAPLPGAVVNHASIGSPASSEAVTSPGERSQQHGFLLRRWQAHRSARRPASPSSPVRSA